MRVASICFAALASLTSSGCINPTALRDCSSDGGTPSGSTYRYVMNGFTLPQVKTDFAIDLNGDGTPDKQLGNIIGTLATQNLNPQITEDSAVGFGYLIELFRLQTTDSTQQDDPAAGLTLNQGIATMSPRYTGTGTFTIDDTVPSALFVGPLARGIYSSSNPVTACTPITLQLPLAFSATNALSTIPVLFPLNGAHVSFTTGTDAASGAPGLLSGEIQGSIKEADVQRLLIPFIAVQLTAAIQSNPSGSGAQTLKAIFDNGRCTNPDGTVAIVGDGIVSICEVANNGIVMAVLAPDVQIFDDNGNYAPSPLNANKDSLSMGFGFTAVQASF